MRNKVSELTVRGGDGPPGILNKTTQRLNEYREVAENKAITNHSVHWHTNNYLYLAQM